MSENRLWLNTDLHNCASDTFKLFRGTRNDYDDYDDNDDGGVDNDGDGDGDGNGDGDGDGDGDGVICIIVPAPRQHLLSLINLRHYSLYFFQVYFSTED